MINRYLALFIYFILSASYAYSFETEKSELGWIGLYNKEMIEWLENQNRIETLCPRVLGSTLQQCRDDKLKSLTWTIDVREKPETTSVKIGTIAITAVPGTGLTAVFHSSNASTAFTPDLFDADWGYGPYFHQTFIDNRNDWFLLPRNPLPKPGWINISVLTKTPDKKNISKTEVYTLRGTGVVLTSIQDEKIKLRAEQPSDMWCEEGNPPKMKPAKVQEIPFSDIVTNDGHLKLKIRYMRGC